MTALAIGLRQGPEGLAVIPVDDGKPGDVMFYLGLEDDPVKMGFYRKQESGSWEAAPELEKSVDHLAYMIRVLDQLEDRMSE